MDGTQFVAHRVVVTSRSSCAGHLAIPRQRRADVVVQVVLRRRALRRFRQARDERGEAGSDSFCLFV